jgi:hypothetical protein
VFLVVLITVELAGCVLYGDGSDKDSDEGSDGLPNCVRDIEQMQDDCLDDTENG